jgi:type I restriction-modification system DNA methylase subunit
MMGTIFEELIFHFFGQEVNPETVAICKSDLFIKRRDVSGGVSLTLPDVLIKMFTHLLTGE